MRTIVFLWIIILTAGAAGAETLTLVTLESPPVEFVRNGKSTGRNVEITTECLARMGFRSQVMIIPWKRALIMVENGTADGIIDAAYTPERGKFLYYPDEAIYVEEWYAFKRKERDIRFDRDLGNLGNYSVGISRGFEYGGLIQEAINAKRFKKIQEVVNNEMNINKLMLSRFDCFIGVKITIFNHLKQMGITDKIDLVPMSETGDPFLLSSSKTYVAFSKKTMTPDVAETFSLTLRQMKEEGRVARIEAAYY